MEPNPITRNNRNIPLLIFSLVSIAGLIGRGIYQIINGIFNSNSSVNFSSSSIFDGIGMFFCAALLLPVIIFTIQKLRGKEIRPARLPPIKLWQGGVLIFIWVFIIILAALLDNAPNFWGLLAIPLFLIGIVLPVFGVVWIAVNGLPTGSWQRFWASLAIGMTGSTIGAILIEYGVVGITALAAGIVAIAKPEWMNTLHRIIDQVMNGGDIQDLLTTLAPTLTNPLVLVLALAFAAFLAPAIEETLKPMTVWLLGKRISSPSEGFALGAVCGAGFALLEGTLAANGSSQMLGIGIAARAASTLMHITASGLMGWGIASAFLQKRYWFLAGTYLLSIFIHGLWNGSVVLAIFGALRLSIAEKGFDPIGILLVITGIGILAFMLLTIIVLLPFINRHMKQISLHLERPAQDVIIAPPQP